MFKKICFFALTVALSLSAFAKQKENKRNTASDISQSAGVWQNTATVKIKEGQLERYLKAASQARIMKLTHQEPGNISYSAYLGIDNPYLVIFSELWKDKQALLISALDSIHKS